MKPNLRVFKRVYYCEETVNNTPVSWLAGSDYRGKKLKLFSRKQDVCGPVMKVEVTYSKTMKGAT